MVVLLLTFLGSGGAAVVSLYRLGFPEAFRPYPADRFNPAVDSRTDIIPGEEDSASSETRTHAPKKAAL